MSPSITVVVPVRNEERTLSTTLDDIVKQTLAPARILVVDGMSEDGTASIVQARAESDQRIELLENPGRTASSALNVGLAATTTELLARVDGHSRIPPDYLATLAPHFSDPMVGGAGGRKDAVADGPTGAAICAVLGSRWGVGNSMYHHAGAVMDVDHVPFGMYRTAVARELGGWDERLVANQDFEFDTRLRKAGYELRLDPSTRTEWTARSKLADLARQYLRYGRGKADVAMLHPGDVRPRHLLPPLLDAALATGVLLAIGGHRRPLRWLSMTYGSFLIAATAQLSSQLSSWRSRLSVPGALVAMQLPWGAGFLLGVCRSVRRGGKVLSPTRDDVARWDSPRWTVGEQRGESDR